MTSEEFACDGIASVCILGTKLHNFIGSSCFVSRKIAGSSSKKRKTMCLLYRQPKQEADAGQNPRKPTYETLKTATSCN